MNYRLFNLLLLVFSAIAAFAIYVWLLPDFIRDGGYLVMVLIWMSILMVAWVTDRLIVFTVLVSWKDPSQFPVAPGVSGKFWLTFIENPPAPAEFRRRLQTVIFTLETNLTGITTLATTATLVGLLGTTLGMIRSFRALAAYGVPDAVQLSMGISEALINTAGGLIVAITGIVFHNLFQRRLERLEHTMNQYHG